MKRIVFTLALLVSCSDPKVDPVPEAPDFDPAAWELTAEEKAWVQEHKAGLNVASSELEGSFTNTPAGPVGFHADLARALGSFLGLPVTFETVLFNSYFSRGGVVPESVKTDPDEVYVPDVFQKADLVAFNLGDLPWRRKLMDFHPVFQTRMVLVTLRGKEISQLSDLAGRRVAVFANTSHELYLRRMKEDLGLDFTLISRPYESDLFAFVRGGNADALVRDANGVMMLLQRNRDFNVTLPLMPTEASNWAVPKHSPVLSAIVEKFLARERATGELAALWEKAFGLSLEAYSNLIGDDPPLDWTASERRTIDALAQTGLRAAINPEQTIYEPQAGTARGVTYNLLLEVAKRLEVPLKLRKVAFHEYFDKDGAFPEQVKTDPGFSYRPDLLDKADVYADTLSPVEWRKKFLAFVSLYPSKLVWVVRKDGPGAPAPGRKIAVLAHSSYQDWLKTRPEVEPGDVVLTSSGAEAIKMVADGRAALSVSDANLALGWLAAYPDITFFPADAAVQDLSWGVDKTNEPLRQVLNKVLDSMRRSGTFASIWQGYYHVPLSEYLDLLAVEKAP